MRVRLPILALAAVLVAGCQSTPPPDPVTMEEIVAFSGDGPDNPALLQALESRPLGFPLTFENLKELERRGVSPAVIDTVVAKTVDRRARALAPRYGYYDPYPLRPWPPWRIGLGYHYDECR